MGGLRKLGRYIKPPMGQIRPVGHQLGIPGLGYQPKTKYNVFLRGCEWCWIGLDIEELKSRVTSLSTFKAELLSRGSSTAVYEIPFCSSTFIQCKKHNFRFCNIRPNRGCLSHFSNHITCFCNHITTHFNNHNHIVINFSIRLWIKHSGKDVFGKKVLEHIVVWEESTYCTITSIILFSVTVVSE